MADLDELANSEGLMDLLGIPRLTGSLTRTQLRDHIAAHDQAGWLAHLKRVEAGGTPSAVVHQLQPAQGRTRNAVTTFVPFIAHGSLRGVFIVIALTDAGDRTAADGAAPSSGSKQTMSTVDPHGRAPATDLHLTAPQLSSTTAALTIADLTRPDAPLVLVSPAFEALTGYTAAELLGRNCRLLQGPDTEPEAVTAIREAVAAGRVLTVTLTNYRRDGSAFRNQLSLAPIRDPLGVVTHYIGYQLEVRCTDLTGAG